MKTSIESREKFKYFENQISCWKNYIFWVPYIFYYVKNLTDSKVWSFLRSWLGPGWTQSLRRPTRIPPSGQIIHHNFTNSFKKNRQITSSHFLMSFSKFETLNNSFQSPWNLKDSHIWHSCFDEKKVMLFSFFFFRSFSSLQAWPTQQFDEIFFWQLTR